MKILLLVLCAFLCSCIDSEAVVSQKESEKIAISAFILGQDSTQIKDTTITLNDSILLIGNIFSHSFRMSSMMVLPVSLVTL